MRLPRGRVGRSAPDPLDDLDRPTAVLEAEAVALQDLFVAPSVEIDEALGELERRAVDGDAAEGPPALFPDLGRKVVAVQGQEPAHVGPLQLEEAGGPVGGLQVDPALRNGAEDPGQHVEEMNPDVRGDAAGLGLVAFPGEEIPAAAAGDIGQVDLVPDPAPLSIDLLLEGLDGRMEPELEDGMDPPARFPLDLPEGVDVPGVEDDRLLADGVGADAEGEPDVGVVEIVGRGDADVIDGLVVPAPAELLDVPVEALELGEEVGFREAAVEDSHGVRGIQGRDQAVPRILDSPHVPGGDIASGADQSEVLHGQAFRSP